MKKLGTTKKPAIVRVQTESRAEAMYALAEEHGVQIIIGIEPDKTEDVSDLEKAIRLRERTHQVYAASPSKNAPCPCGSGRKYKGCCMGKARQE